MGKTEKAKTGIAPGDKKMHTEAKGNRRRAILRKRTAESSASSLLDARPQESPPELEAILNIYSNSPVALYRTSIQTGQVIEGNDQLARLFGYATREKAIVSLNIGELYVKKSDRAELLKLLYENGSVQNFEADFYRLDGSIFTARYSASIYPEHGWIEGVAQDVTAQVNTERALRASESRIKNLLDAVPHLIYECDTRGKITLASSAALNITGYTKEEMVGSYVWEGMAPGLQRDQIQEYLKYLAKEQPAPKPYVAKNIKKDGTTIDVQVDWTYRRNDLGKVNGFICLMADISARKRAQRALMESERMLSTLMSNLPGMAFRCRYDKLRTLEFVSQGCTGLTGFTKQEVENNPAFSYASIIHPDDLVSVLSQIDEAVAKRSPFAIEYRIISVGNEEKWVWEQGTGVYSISGNIIALEGHITDITDRRRIESELREASKILLEERAILNEKNIALSHILEHMEEQKREFGSHLTSEIQSELLPVLERLTEQTAGADKKRLERAKTQITTILSKDIDDFRNHFSRLSPREIQISEYIAAGMTTKQISYKLNISPATINKHREFIRKKLDLSNTQTNLSTYLKTNLSSQLRIL